MTAARTGEHPAQVVSVQSVTPLLRRITLRSPSLPAATLLQDVALVLPDPDDPAQVVRRRYTVRNQAGGVLSLDAVLHGHGPGARWAARAAPGDVVALYGPRGGASPMPATRYLLLADDAGLPAVAELLPRLAGHDVAAAVEIPDAAEAQPVDGVRWLVRDGRPAGDATALLDAARRFAPRAGDGAFVLAESRVVAAVRELLLAAGLERRAVHAKGYWNRDDPRRAGSRP